MLQPQMCTAGTSDDEEYGEYLRNLFRSEMAEARPGDALERDPVEERLRSPPRELDVGGALLGRALEGEALTPLGLERFLQSQAWDRSGNHV